jgi:SPP1 gp7 family putative phage head morphogenesis protein
MGARRSVKASPTAPAPATPEAAPGAPEGASDSSTLASRATPNINRSERNIGILRKNDLATNSRVTIIPLYDESQARDAAGGQEEDPITDEQIELLLRRDELADITWRGWAGGVFNKWLVPRAETPKLEQAIQDMFERLKVKEISKAAYVLAKVYGYSVVGLGLEGGGEDLAQDPGKPTGIAYLHAISKKIILKMVQDLDPTSPTYGELTSYVLSIPSGTERIEQIVHARRMIHWRNPWIDDSPEGISMFEPLYDKFLSKRNMDFAVGETLFRNAKPWPNLEVPEDADTPEVDAAEATFKNINVRSYFISPPGYKFNLVGTNNALNPQPYLDYMLTTLAAGAMGGKTAMLGTEAGAVTGSEINMHEKYSKISDEQSNFVEPMLHELVTRAQNWGLLPAGRFWFEWNTLWEMDEGETADIEYKRALALQATAIALGSLKASGFEFTAEEGELVVLIGGQPINLPGANSLPVRRTFANKRRRGLRFAGYPIRLTPGGNATAPPLDQVIHDELLAKMDIQTADLENRMAQIFQKHLTLIRDEFFARLKALWVKNIGPIEVDPTAPVAGAKADTSDLYGELTDWETKDLAAFKADIIKFLTEANKQGRDKTLQDLGVTAPTKREEFGKLDEAAIKKIEVEGARLAKQTYLDNHKQAMNEIAEGIRQGQSYAQIADRVAGKFAEFNDGIPNTVQKFIHTVKSEARWDTMQSHGFDKGVFLTAKDDRVRDSHRAMDGQVVTREQAMKYLSEFGCRCVISPLTVYDQFVAMGKEEQQEMIDRYAT